MVEVAAGDVGGQELAAGLVDEVRMDVIPLVFGCGKRYFGSVDAQESRHLTQLHRPRRGVRSAQLERRPTRLASGP